MTSPAEPGDLLGVVPPLLRGSLRASLWDNQTPSIIRITKTDEVSARGEERPRILPLGPFITLRSRDGPERVLTTNLPLLIH